MELYNVIMCYNAQGIKKFVSIIGTYTTEEEAKKCQKRMYAEEEDAQAWIYEIAKSKLYK